MYIIVPAFVERFSFRGDNYSSGKVTSAQDLLNNGVYYGCHTLPTDYFRHWLNKVKIFFH